MKGEKIMWLFWLVVAGIFFVGEIITVGFLVFWLGVGALFAMLVSFITNNIIIQTAVFVVSSVALIFLTKPLIKKYIDNQEFIPTNAESLIGKRGKVIKEISDCSGLVKINGEVWTAVSEDNSLIVNGRDVKVVKIDGVKLIVKP